MRANENVIFLELLRDDIDKIRASLGPEWTKFVRLIRPLLGSLAQTDNAAEAARFIDEIIAISVATPAALTIHQLKAEAKRKALRHERRRGFGPVLPPSEAEQDLPVLLAGAAATLFEWLTPTDQYRYRSVPIFFATDRSPTGDRSPNKFFGGERGLLSYGIARVSVPERHEMGHVERPLTLFPESPERHVTLLGVGQATSGSFLQYLDDALGVTRAPKILLFVHGYRVPFADAARALAQMSFDLNFSGLPVLYSWPSKGSFLGYRRDEENAAWTQEHFLKMLETLRALRERAELHLLSHSMGCSIVFQGLQFMKEKQFRQVMLAAPDVDADTFDTQLHRFVGHADRNTVYASRKDVALRLSRWIHGAERTGQIGSSGMDSIDASAVNFSRFGHSYFHDQRALLTDIFLVVEHGMPPSQRPSIRPSPEAPMWIFQP